MAINTVTSLAGTAAGAGINNNILADNGTIVRIRDGQSFTLSDYDTIDLSIPSGEPIVGIDKSIVYLMYLKIILMKKQ